MKPVTLGVIGVVIAAGAAGTFLYLEQDTPPAEVASAPATAPAPAPAPAPAQPAPQVTAPAPAPAATNDEKPAESTVAIAPPPKPEEPAEDTSPKFDIVRVEPDGSTIIAGRAAPNVVIILRDGNTEIARATTDDQGEFVQIPDLPLDPGNRVLTLEEVTPDGQVRPSTDSVVVVVPEPGKDVAGNEATAETDRTPLAMVIPRTEGATAPSVVLQAPKAPETPGAPAVSAAPAPPPVPDTAPAPAQVAAATETPSSPDAQESGQTVDTAAAAASTEETNKASDPAESTAVANTASGTDRAGKVQVPGVVIKTFPETKQVEVPKAPETQVTSAQSSSTESAAPADSATAATVGASAGTTAGTTAATAPAAPDKSDTSSDGSVAEVRSASESQVAALPAGTTPTTSTSQEEPASSAPAAAATPASTATPTPTPTPALQAPTGAAATVETTAPTAPSGVATGTTETLSVDTVDYDDKGEVVFSGTAEPEAEVQVYVDNKIAGRTKAGDEGKWVLKPEEAIEPGTHTVRIDRIEPTGDVLARVELPFVRAEPLRDLPAGTVVIIQPGNNLWRIATRVYGSGLRYTEIFQANQEQIRDPNLIYPGQVFGLPDVN